MTSIGKYLAAVVALALLLFIPVSLFLPEFIDKFISFATQILAIVVGVGVVYIIIKMKK
jgi:hypothetical protein